MLCGWRSDSNPHLDRLDEVFDCIKIDDLKCKSSKSEILRNSIKYLERMVDKHGLRPDPDAVEAVITMKAAKMETKLMNFLGSRIIIESS